MLKRELIAMRSGRVFVGLIAVLVGCAMMAPVARGDIVYSSVGSASSYDNVGWASLEYDPPFLDLARAVAFTPAHSYALTSLELGLGWNAGVNLTDVWLMSDAGNTPGATIESLQVAGARPYDPGTFTPTTMLLVEVDSISHPVLHAGTQYWVGASAANTSPNPDPHSGDSFVYWLQTLNPSSSETVADRNLLDPWVVSTILYGPQAPYGPQALRVNGELVPVPGAVLLGILGLGSAGGWLRRRRML